MDKNQVHFPKKYLTNVGVTYANGVYTVSVFTGDRSLSLELTRSQAINLFDELSDLIDLDLKVHPLKQGDHPSKTKYRPIRRLYIDPKDYKAR